MRRIAPQTSIGGAHIQQLRARRVEHPEHVVDVLGHLPEAFFALAQRALRAAHAQQRAHLRDQFGRLDRLGQIAVRAAFEAAHPVHALHRRRRRVDHEHARGLGRGLDAAAHFEAAQIGQIDVEQHEVRLRNARALDRLRAVAGLDHDEARARQDARLRVTSAFVIVDVEDQIRVCIGHEKACP
ncbi:hypothetical protein QFZ96_007231 [Paraburkholderia youngii]